MNSLKLSLDIFGVHVDSVGLSGGLVLLWTKELRVSLRSLSRNFIEILVDVGGRVWRLTGFTGEVDSLLHQNSWNLIRTLRQQIDLTRLCFGDFNAILFPHEKDSTMSTPPWQIQDFRAVIEDVNLCHLGYIGPKFTWGNNRERPLTVRSRLDKAFTDDAWRRSFFNTLVRHLSSPYINHILLLVDLFAQDAWELLPRVKSFWFEALWFAQKNARRWFKEHGRGKNQIPWLHGTTSRTAGSS